MIDAAMRQRLRERLHREVERDLLEWGHWRCEWAQCKRCGSRMWVEVQEFGAVYGAGKAGCCWRMEAA